MIPHDWLDSNLMNLEQHCCQYVLLHGFWGEESPALLHHVHIYIHHVPWQFPEFPCGPGFESSVFSDFMKFQEDLAQALEGWARKSVDRLRQKTKDRCNSWTPKWMRKACWILPIKFVVGSYFNVTDSDNSSFSKSTWSSFVAQQELSGWALWEYEFTHWRYTKRHQSQSRPQNT